MSRADSPQRINFKTGVVPETPEYALKKKGKRLLVFSDSESSDQIEESDDAVSKSESPGESRRNDELGSLAFGTNLKQFEKSFNLLKKHFPTVDDLKLQDVLVSCRGEYLKACTAVRRLYPFIKNKKRKRFHESNGHTWSSRSQNGDVSPIQSQDYKAYLQTFAADGKKPTSKSVLSENSSDEEIITIPNRETRGERLNRRRKFKAASSSDEESEPEASMSSESEDSEDEAKKDDIGGLLSSSGNEDENYDEEDVIVSGSDDDDDGEVEGVQSKDRPSKETYRNEVLNLLQSGLDCDLLSIPTVSQKKLELLKDLRPLISWNDLISKLEDHRTLTIDLLNQCMQTVKSRNVVSRLMMECEQLAESINKSVSNLKPINQPKHLNDDYKLTQYQLIGLNWLSLMYQKGINCILADEMGLGKTIQVIALLAYLYEKYSIPGPHLVVVPSSTLENWIREFETWLPSFQILPYYGSQDDRAHLRAQLSSGKKNEYNSFNVMVTTYNMLHNEEDRKYFRKMKFVYVVFDEAHMLKNMKSARYNNLIQIQGKRRLLLTGTPLQNDLLELMSLLVFAMPSLFSKHTHHIKSLFSNAKESAQSSFVKERIEQAKKILKPFILRRLKDDVLKDLPSKVEIIEKCPMSQSQEQTYMDLIENCTRNITYNKENIKKNSDYDEHYGTFKRAQGMLMELRKAANHPLLIRRRFTEDILRKMSEDILKEPTHKDANAQFVFEDMTQLNDFELHNLCLKYRSLAEYKLDSECILDSGKFNYLDKMVPKVIKEGKRLLLFSQFVIALDIIEEYMKLRGFKYLRLDGSTKVSERLGFIDEFNNDSSISVFLLSTRAGGMGINLTAASVVIIHDIDFNPYNDKQAEDRCHRMGQKKEVTVVRLISENTVEEGMLKICEEKLKLGSEICQSKLKEEMELEVKDVKKLLRQALNL